MRFFLCAVSLALPALLALPDASRSKWGPIGCAMAFAPPAVAGMALGMIPAQHQGGYEWRRRADLPDAYLHRYGVQIGGWSLENQHYRPYDSVTGVWGPPTPPPIAPPPDLVRSTPAPIEKKLEPWQTQGVSGQLISDHRESINGVTVTQSKAGKQGELIDDSGKLFLSVFARSPERRAQVVADLKANPKVWAWVQERCHLWAGEAATPEHFLSKSRDGQPLYAINGEPTIMLQDAAGVELWHDAGYTQGPPSLEAMRCRDPKYKPDDTPGPKTPLPGVGDNTLWLLFVGCGIVAAIFFLVPAKKDSA